MPASLPAIDEFVTVTSDAELVGRTMERIRSMHAEVELEPVPARGDLERTSERRQGRRVQLQLPVLLVPADWDTEVDNRLVVCGCEQVGVTRDISASGKGLGITHDELLGSDAAIVQFDLPGEGPLDVVLDLRWSVRKARYSYLSGGRVVAVVNIR